jgi:hypothetical protein
MIPTAWRLTLEVERFYRCGLTSVIARRACEHIPAEGSHRWTRPYKCPVFVFDSNHGSRFKSMSSILSLPGNQTERTCYLVVDHGGHLCGFSFPQCCCFPRPMLTLRHPSPLQVLAHCKKPNS